MSSAVEGPTDGDDGPPASEKAASVTAGRDPETTLPLPGRMSERSASVPESSEVETTSGCADPTPKSSASVPGSDPLSLRVGELLAGRFTLLRRIAQGGMGVVYEADDSMLRSRVALKVIRGRVATDATALERFRREVLLARRVSHFNVCRVYELYDAVTASGDFIHFLTMEFLEGETLSQLLARQGRLNPAEALPLVRQLCAGLSAAHSQGVVHRDFKSSNVMVVRGEKGSGDSTCLRVVITDFGIARALQLGPDEEHTVGLTGGDGILGTPEYMAPEQVTGGPVTQASDIYALGVVLYEIVTGKLPFSGGTAMAVAAKRLQQAPPRPEAATKRLDSRWSQTILRCLSREPERRFKNALDIPAALERTARPWARPVVATAALIAAVSASLVLFGAFPGARHQEPPRPAVSPTLAPANPAQLPGPAAPSVPVARPDAPVRKDVVSPGLSASSPGRKKVLQPKAPLGPPGVLVLTVGPWGEVLIDGASRGEQVGRVEYALSPGPHQVEVKGPSRWGPKEILIESGKTSSQVISFK